jgi:hypothetical protein
MKNSLLTLLLLLVACNSQRIINQDKYIVFDNINIIDVINGGIIENQTVVIKDSIIDFIGTEWKSPPNSKINRINGFHKYLIPGLWDMHFHLSWEKGNDSLLFPALFANGITGIRDMGGDLEIQNKIKEANKIRPEIYGAGPIIDGNPPVMYDFSIPVDTHTDISKLLDSITNLGSDFIKTYSLIKYSELKKIADYTKRNNITFAGHLSEYIDPEVSINLGQKSIEHLNRLDEIWATDSTRIYGIAEIMIKNGTWLCPTLDIYYNKMKMRDTSIFENKYENYIHPILAKEWNKSRENAISKKDSLYWQKKEQEFNRNSRLVYFLQKKGVNILAGSDFAGMPYVYPGIGLIKELKLLNKAGLSNLEVIQTATINPAKYFSISNNFGSVTVGKFADLVVLNENPLTEIGNIEAIELVIKKGEIVINTTAIIGSRK